MSAHMWDVLTKNFSALKKTRQQRRRTKPYQPRVELLEERLALSTLVVNTVTDPVVPVRGLLSLRQALAASQDGDTILLAAKGTYKLTNNDGGEGTDLDVNTSVTISSKAGAASVIIDGNKTDRVFAIDGSENVVLQGITIQNGVIDDAGAGIYVNDGGGSLNLNTVVVRYNTASDDGGGLYVDDDTYVKINNSTFNNNACGGDGGGVAFYGSSMLVSNTTFKLNKAGGDGGAIGFYGYVEGNDYDDVGFGMDLTLVGSTFTGNKAGDEGGAVDFYGSADDDGDWHDLDMNVQKCTFADNVAGSYGGGMNLYSDSPDVDSSMTISGSTFRNNSGTYGGGICTENIEDMDIDRSIFTNNRGSDDGGGVYVEDGDHLNVINSSFSGNVGESGAGIYCDYTDLTIDRSTFTNNRATSWGGALSANYDDDGYYEVEILNSTFTSNASTAGGAVAIEEAGDVTIDRCTFSKNRANYSGGAIFVIEEYAESSNAYDVDTYLTITNCTIDRNTAGGQGDDDEGGGGIYYYAENNCDSYLTITGNTVTNNVSGRAGGGIWIEGYDSEEDDYDFHATLVGNNITGNTAGTVGGGIWIDADAATNEVMLEKNTLAGNRASDDGAGLALYADLDDDCCSWVTVAANTFSANTTSNDGGGASIESYGLGRVLLVNNTICNNAAGDDGGGLSMDVENGQLVNNTIAFNKAQDVGGGLYNDNNLEVLNTLIAKNTCGSGDGVDVFQDDGVLTDLGYNLIGIDDQTLFTLATDIAGTTVAPVDPRLGPLAANGGPTKTMALKKGSAAINAGTAPAPGNNVPEFDQRGVLRGPLVDIGAFEVV